MTWTIEFTSRARKELAKASLNDQRRILSFLHERVAPLDNPRQLGAALTGPLSGYWKYRIGDHRVIARIEDQKVAIVVVQVGNRRDVYR
jgi:mRNA interferase RelE/StbE